MSLVTITCQCGQTANAKYFTQGPQRKGTAVILVELPANEWYCHFCGVKWKVTLQGIQILSYPRTVSSPGHHAA